MPTTLPERTAAIMDAEPGTVFETCWTGSVPLSLRASIRAGKVHLTTRESYPHTLCGRLIPLPSKRLFPRPDTPHCTTCTKSAEKESAS